MSDELFTRDSFIADDYVQIAISNANTIWSKDGPLREIPMPQSIKESGVLPEGYCVAFMHDPATTIRGLASIGINYPSQLKKEVFDGLKAIINEPDNLAIVPIVARDEKLRGIIEALGPPEPATKANSA